MRDSRLPMAEGECAVGQGWALTLPGQFSRFEHGHYLILKRADLVIEVIVRDAVPGENAASRLAYLREQTPFVAFDQEHVEHGEELRYSYRTLEERGREVVHALHGFAVAARNEVQITFYFDAEDGFADARRIWRSLHREVAPA